MAKAIVDVTHHIYVPAILKFEVEIEIPDGLDEAEAEAILDDYEQEIRSKLKDGKQYETDIGSGGRYDPYEGSVYLSLVSYENEKEVLSKNVDTRSINNIKFNMVYCPAGEFWMGSEVGVGINDERPRHRVKMAKGFWMGETQVTQELWQAVMGWNPSRFKGSAKLPAEGMTWYDCLVFCNQLSELEGFKPCYALSQITNDGKHITSAEVEWIRDANGYRLPTEAEWEYSAKAGTELTYSGSNSIDKVAWYYGNSMVNGLYTTHDVKTKKANAWGLYDMTGNVGEWCHDMWDEEAYQNRVNVENPVKWQNGPCARVVRGGSYGDGAGRGRVADRRWDDADARVVYWGLRLLRFEP